MDDDLFGCEGCADPNGGVYIASCQRCQARNIALGPHFFASARAGKFTSDYRVELERVFGPAWREGHEIVKAEAKRVTRGSVAA